jgi:hypothetical protein
MLLCKKDRLVPPWQYIHISFILNYGKVSYFFLREKKLSWNSTNQKVHTFYNSFIWNLAADFESKACRSL